MGGDIIFEGRRLERMNELLWGMNEVKSPQLSRRQELSSHQQRGHLEKSRITNLALRKTETQILP